MSRRREVLAVLGQTGAGKTTWTRKFLADKNRMLLLDSGFEEFPATYYPGLDATIAALNERQAEEATIPFRAAFTPARHEQNDAFEFSKYLGNHWLVIEEADRFDPLSLPAYDDLIARGRHAGVNMVLITRHPYAIHKDVRREITRLVSFRLIDPDDLKWASHLIGEEAFELPTFPNYKFIDKKIS